MHTTLTQRGHHAPTCRVRLEAKDHVCLTSCCLCCCCRCLDDGREQSACASASCMQMHPRATTSCTRRTVRRSSCIQPHNERHVRMTSVDVLPPTSTCEQIPSIDVITCGHVRVRKPAACVCIGPFDTWFEASVETHEAPWKRTRANLHVEREATTSTRTKRTRTARWTKDGEDGAKR